MTKSSWPISVFLTLTQSQQRRPVDQDERGPDSAWTNATKSAISKLRVAGLRHALMADAPSWGQDGAGTVRNTATSVLAADPDHNTVFSVHLYGVYDTAAEAQNYLNHFVDNRLPVVVGEFGLGMAEK
ncbi:cellulase family glycosylhydrolase [Streptomyces sp. NPDC006458]|uniref:cellulase family glycosylhydrolase n=1 Tax=Streptomyces sp. NPDC006458 TaxID=3154302 RepID=UPI0033BF9225